MPTKQPCVHEPINDVYPPLPYYPTAEFQKSKQMSLEVMLQAKQAQVDSQAAIKKARELIWQSKSLRHRSKQLVSDAYHIPVIQSCSCGMKYSPTTWTRLPLLGYEEYGHMDAEMRNCPCGSTLTVIIERRESDGT